MREVLKWRKGEEEFILKKEQKRFGVYATISLKKKEIFHNGPYSPKGKMAAAMPR